MLVSLTVGKVDAGMAVLLTEDKRIIEFPSILLPPDISSGSIVDITVSRNLSSESAAQKAFTNLQTTIFQTFGLHSPAAPILRCRNATQTSLVLEWDPIELATAELRSLSLYRNGSKAGCIPRPTELHSTKISGLAVDTEYTFHLVLKTSAGTYSSEKLTVRTHKMTDLSGITITPGIMPSALKESLVTTVDRIGAKLIDTVRIDTTHFVCTEGRGQAWEKAVEMNIPIVVPDWIKGCEREGRLVGVRGYYLNADPRLRQVGPSPGVNTAPPASPTPTTHVTPPTPERKTRDPRGMSDRNGRGSIEEEPPTPPPKHDRPGSSSSGGRPGSSASGSTTLVDRTSKMDGKSKDQGPPPEAEDSERDEPESPQDAPSTPPANRKATVEDEAEDNASFQDVAL
ncbi:chitin biosynthesis protein [Venturia nashicola]|uniref:Chitin biosynthesis protein n=1 Tax=Venturia nashicola TaxID=86259 RepID=A0A4Z1PDA6_9PEZI|nr:chitin biosynthesis protein [Venturia nashicola]TLD30273.1 chitin biosynthesis protein [Venturia nashicola]